MFKQILLFFNFLSLIMDFFDFHHHHKLKYSGIYNLSSEEFSSENLKITEILFSAGIHPAEIDKNWQQNLDKLKEISLHENCFGIGECGLDALIKIDKNLQEKVFIEQILWANKIKRPIIIHCVRKFSDILKFKKTAKVPMVIHGFNKKKSIADELLKHGFYFSFGKSVLHNLSLQTLIKDFPAEKMFLETDDADFDIADLYLKVAEIKGISVEELQEQISKNLEILNIKF